MGKKSKKSKNKKDKNEPETIMLDEENTKNALQRMAIVQEIENKLIAERIETELGSRVLLRILDDYVTNGTRYIGKEVKLLLKAGEPRKFIINLYNDRRLRDQVLIRLINNDS